MRRWLNIVPLLPLLAGGCMTHKLWTESNFDEWNGPAAPPNLRLFRDPRRQDILVVYDEYSDRRETTRTRAYFLDASRTAGAQHQRPHFVTAKILPELERVPVLPAAPTNAAAKTFAVSPPGTDRFTLFTNGIFAGRHELPAYDDGLGQAERIAWTPLAVTADLTIIGGCLGCWWIYSGGPGLGR